MVNSKLYNPQVRCISLLLLLLAAFITGSPASLVQADSQLPVVYQKLAHDIFRELVEINTTSTLGTQRAAEGLKARLITAGIDDVKILGSSPEKANLVVRYI